MYKLFVQFQDGSKFDNKLNEKQLRGILKNGLRGPVSYATVFTPSGVSKDVTRTLQTI